MISQFLPHEIKRGREVDKSRDKAIVRAYGDVGICVHASLTSYGTMIPKVNHFETFSSLAEAIFRLLECYKCNGAGLIRPPVSISLQLCIKDSLISWTPMGRRNTRESIVGITMGNIVLCGEGPLRWFFVSAKTICKRPPS